MMLLQKEVKEPYNQGSPSLVWLEFPCRIEKLDCRRFFFFFGNNNFFLMIWINQIQSWVDLFYIWIKLIWIHLYSNLIRFEYTILYNQTNQDYLRIISSTCNESCRLSLETIMLNFLVIHFFFKQRQTIFLTKMNTCIL